MNSQVFNPVQSVWTTNPLTPIKGLYVAEAAVCGAMYGGVLIASKILGYMGSLRMVCASLYEFATAFQTENPK
jgi:hypothetical protein